MGCDIMRGARSTKFGLIEKRILILGLDNAGKTSILSAYQEQSHDTQRVPTIGLSIEEVYVKDYKLTFWDVGGQAARRVPRRRRSPPPRQRPLQPRRL